MNLTYLSLGSNLGERESQVLRVARDLESEGVATTVRMSSLYETSPVDCEPMPPFVNAVAQFHSLLEPENLLTRLQGMEMRAGRSGGHNQARQLDLDIIACGDIRLESPQLVIPHPRYHARKFVLVPLQEIAPNFVCPATSRGIDELVSALPADQKVTRISGRSVHAGRGPR